MNSVRNASRSAASRQQGPLIPFLYLTRTIQRHYASNHSQTGAEALEAASLGSKERYRHEVKRILQQAGNVTSRNDGTYETRGRNAAGAGKDRSRPRDHIPFDSGPHESAADLDVPDSTITPNERRAFARLFDLMSSGRADNEDKAKNAKSLDRSPEEGRGSYVPRDATRKAASRHSTLDAILAPELNRAEIALEKRSVSPVRRTRFPPALTAMAEEAKNKQMALIEQSKEKRRRRVVELKGRPYSRAAIIERAVREDYERVDKLMSEAQTDLELWEVLQREVLERVKALGLDDPPVVQAVKQVKKRKKAAKPANDANALETASGSGKVITLPPKTTDLTIQPTPPPQTPPPDPIPPLALLGPNFPAFLLRTQRLLRIDFPSSTLGLTLLPTLKALGPSSYALGASTKLYNETMTLLFEKYTDLRAVSDMLHEMDREVFEFDEETLALLHRIMQRAYVVREGRAGESESAVWGMERATHAIGHIARYRGIVVKRFEEQALRKARGEEEEAGREDETDGVGVAAAAG